MGYYIRAFIGKKEVVEVIKKDYQFATVVPLYKDFYLIPAIDDLLDGITKCQPSSKVGNFIYLNDKINNYLKEISSRNRIAYVEADYFGGRGGQGAVVWDNGNLILLSDFIFKTGAINKALSKLGVKRNQLMDQFEIAGLDRNRDLEDWLDLTESKR